MVDYRIGEWQLEKLKEAIQLTQDNKIDAKLLEQCLSIIKAIERSQPFEAPVVNIPFVQAESCVSHAESHSKPEDYEGITAHANNTK